MVIPKFLCQFFWDYDCKKLDLKKNQRLIITQILHVGSQEACAWLFQNYQKEEIREVLKKLRKGDLDAKSKQYWKLMLDM